MVREAKFIQKDIYNYLLSNSVRDNKLLLELNQETQRVFNIPMQSSPEALNFFQWLIKTLKIRKVLELGTYTGLSALAMAQALPEDGELITCDRSEDFTELAKIYWAKSNLSNKIVLKLGDAKETLTSMAASYHDYFDLIFIDADKPQYHCYYEICLDLLKQGGVIMFDNVFLAGDVIDEANQKNRTQMMRQFNEMLFQDERVNISMLPLGDGLTLVTKK